jgi:hypothetical protein
VRAPDIWQADTSIARRHLLAWVGWGSCATFSGGVLAMVAAWVRQRSHELGQACGSFPVFGGSCWEQQGYRAITSSGCAIPGAVAGCCIHRNMVRMPCEAGTGTPAGRRNREGALCASHGFCLSPHGGGVELI